VRRHRRTSPWSVVAGARLISANGACMPEAFMATPKMVLLALEKHHPRSIWTEGEFVSLLAPSGCGKSTFLALAFDGLERKNPRLVCCSTVARSRGRQEKFGIAFQRRRFARLVLILENRSTRPISAVSTENVRAPRARELLTMVGLKAFTDVYPSALRAGRMRHKAQTILPFAAADQPASFGMDALWSLDELTRIKF